MVFSDQIFRVVTTAPFRVENDDTEIYHRPSEKANPKTAMLRALRGQTLFRPLRALSFIRHENANLPRVGEKIGGNAVFFQPMMNDER